MHALTTNQCEAFCVCNINFCARDVRTTHALTTDLCGAHSGLPQLDNYTDVKTSGGKPKKAVVLKLNILAGHDLLMLAC